MYMPLNAKVINAKSKTELVTLIGLADGTQESVPME